MTKRRRAKRSPASRTLTTPGKSYTLDGEGGRGTPKASRRAAPLLRPLMSRLRRLEVLVLFLTGRIKIDHAMVEKMLDNVQELEEATKDLGTESRNKEV